MTKSEMIKDCEEHVLKVLLNLDDTVIKFYNRNTTQGIAIEYIDSYDSVFECGFSVHEAVVIAENVAKTFMNIKEAKEALK